MVFVITYVTHHKEGQLYFFILLCINSSILGRRVKTCCNVINHLQHPLFNFIIVLRYKDNFVFVDKCLQLWVGEKVVKAPDIL